jgi:hypothetical protein
VATAFTEAGIPPPSPSPAPVAAAS